jgi:hypothetical protein
MEHTSLASVSPGRTSFARPACPAILANELDCFRMTPPARCDGTPPP